MRKELITELFRMDVKRKLAKTWVKITLLYGCEMWMLKKEEIKRLETVDHRNNSN